jgi:hypothetical protein
MDIIFVRPRICDFNEHPFIWNSIEDDISNPVVKMTVHTRAGSFLRVEGRMARDSGMRFATTRAIVSQMGVDGAADPILKHRLEAISTSRLDIFMKARCSVKDCHINYEMLRFACSENTTAKKKQKKKKKKNKNIVYAIHVTGGRLPILQNPYTGVF